MGPEGGAGNYTGHNSLRPGWGPGGFCAGDWWPDTTGGQWWGTSVLTMVHHSELWCAVQSSVLRRLEWFGLQIIVVWRATCGCVHILLSKIYVC